MVHDVTRRRGLVHPLPLASVALLLLNDHVLKRACPSWLTGKLSDFAGLFFFPLLLVAVAELSERLRRRRRLVASIACVATAGVFAAIKVSPACNALANHVGTFVFDPTDVVALASVAAAWFFAVDRPRPSAGVTRWQTGVAIVVAAGASVATSRPPTVPQYPAWSVTDGGPTDVGCAKVEAWVPKSGRDGFGLAVLVDAPAGCDARIGGAFRAGSVTATSNTVVVEGGGQHWIYLSFAFDNLALFDAHVEEGELVLTLDGAAPTTRVLHLQQRPVPPFGHDRTGWAPASLVGPSFVTTSCGDVRARAEKEQRGLRVVFTVAPRCDVHIGGRFTPSDGSPQVSELHFTPKQSHEGIDGDFWVIFPRSSGGRVDLQLKDGERVIDWSFDISDRASPRPEVRTR